LNDHASEAKPSIPPGMLMGTAIAVSSDRQVGQADLGERRRQGESQSRWPATAPTQTQTPPPKILNRPKVLEVQIPYKARPQSSPRDGTQKSALGSSASERNTHRGKSDKANKAARGQQGEEGESERRWSGRHKRQDQNGGDGPPTRSAALWGEIERITVVSP
jgi:hypothetical protein